MQSRPILEAWVRPFRTTLHSYRHTNQLRQARQGEFFPRPESVKRVLVSENLCWRQYLITQDLHTLCLRNCVLHAGELHVCFMLKPPTPDPCLSIFRDSIFSRMKPSSSDEWHALINTHRTRRHNCEQASQLQKWLSGRPKPRWSANERMLHERMTMSFWQWARGIQPWQTFTSFNRQWWALSATAM